jgi:hypothetical protein
MNTQPQLQKVNDDVRTSLRHVDYEAVADCFEDKYIRREYTDQEKEEMAETVTKNCIAIADQDAILQVAKDEYKIAADPLKKQNKLIINNLRRGYEENSVRCYGLANHEKGLMEFYTEDGEFVESRRLLPNERQLHIK